VKWIVRILVVFVVLVAGFLVSSFWWLDGAAKSAIESADLLVPKGKRIASLRDRAGEVKAFVAKQGALAKGLGGRIFALIDERTRSGAELFAAALKAHRSARLIGGRSFGKWNVQKIAKLSNGYAIRYTIGQLLDPAGHHHHGKGLQPDIPVAASSSKLDHHRSIQDIKQRLTRDSQMRVAHAMLAAM